MGEIGVHTRIPVHTGGDMRMWVHAVRLYTCVHFFLVDCETGKGIDS